MRQSPIRDLHRPDKSSGIPTRRPMNDVSCILRQPDYLASNSRSDHWIEFAQLRTCLRAYFDFVGHETWRGFHALNFPAKSWRRASRSSAMIFGFCDVNQSKSSSRFSTDESTGTGISTVSFGISPAYRFELEKQTAVSLSSRSPDRYRPSTLSYRLAARCVS